MSPLPLVDEVQTQPTSDQRSTQIQAEGAHFDRHSLIFLPELPMLHRAASTHSPSEPSYSPSSPMHCPEMLCTHPTAHTRSVDPPLHLLDPFHPTLLPACVPGAALGTNTAPSQQRAQRDGHSPSNAAATPGHQQCLCQAGSLPCRRWIHDDVRRF